MAHDAETTALSMLAMFDNKDIPGMLGIITADFQGVDEISRRWLRGADEIKSYLAGLSADVSDIRSDVQDVHTAVWGDTALVTMWVEQDYTYQGAPVHVSAPITMVVRKEGVWKVALVAAVPVPPAE